MPSHNPPGVLPFKLVDLWPSFTCPGLYPDRQFHQIPDEVEDWNSQEIPCWNYSQETWRSLVIGCILLVCRSADRDHHSFHTLTRLVPDKTKRSTKIFLPQIVTTNIVLYLFCISLFVQPCQLPVVITDPLQSSNIRLQQGCGYVLRPSSRPGSFQHREEHL
jgi:hypothetical protein